MEQIQYHMASPIGPLYVVVSNKGLDGIFFKKQPSKVVKSVGGATPHEKVLSQTLTQLTEYFAGQRQQFDVPLNLQGTLFQIQVWKQLAKIPYGHTVSYRDIAKRIKNPKAVRAVGSANGKNPVCIIIPCHRVIAADGTIGGYGGGLTKKRQLLSLEQQ